MGRNPFDIRRRSEVIRPAARGGGGGGGVGHGGGASSGSGFSGPGPLTWIDDDPGAIVPMYGGPPTAPAHAAVVPVTADLYVSRTCAHCLRAIEAYEVAGSPRNVTLHWTHDPGVIDALVRETKGKSIPAIVTSDGRIRIGRPAVVATIEEMARVP